MKPYLLYLTTANAEEAEKIARHLLENRLIACANISDGLRSLYRWEGRTADDTECLLLMKTTEASLEAVKREVLALHSYSCPGLSVVPIEDGNPAFLEWIATETGAA